MPGAVRRAVSRSAALCAANICPASKDYMIASHMSGEPAAKFVFEKLGIRAPICANMALGEGTGAVALMPLLDMAYAVYGGMLAFSDAGIEEYKPL